MGWFTEVLKRLGLSKSLLTFAYKKEVGREAHIKVKASKGSDVKVFFIEVTKDVLANAKEFVKVEGGELGGFSREDIAGFHAQMLTPTPNEQGVLTTFEGILTDEQYAALVAALAICRYEDKKMDDIVLRLRDDLRRKYGEVGNRVYQLVRSGFMVDWFFKPAFYAKYEAVDSADAQRQFSGFFQRCIDYFPAAIFVNRTMSQGKIITELSQRFHLHDAVIVYVFGRTREINVKCWKACQGFAREEAEKGFEYNVSFADYKLGTTSAILVTVRRLWKRKSH
ncbi:MAG: hypothetical protein V3U52_06380 [Thermoplasmata archaeon]